MTDSEKFWDGRAQSFDADAKKDEETKLGSVQKSEKYLNSSDVVLDYGCASGIKAFALAEMVQEVQGIDISANMIALARKNAAKRGIGNVHFRQGTIMDPQLKAASFNAIFAFNILHLVGDAEPTVNRIHELLPPGGIFVSETAVLGEKRSWLGFLLPILKIFGLVPDVTRFSSAELESMIAGEGFEILETADMGDMTYFIAARKE